MTLPDASYVRVTQVLSGPALPRGAAVVYCLQKEDDSPITLTMANAQGSIFATTLMTVISSGVLQTATIMKQGPDETGLQIIAPASNSGSLAGTGASSAVSFLLHKQSTLGGRRGRGRMYLPGVLEADVGSDGALTGAKVTSLNSECSDFMTAQAASPGIFGVALEHAPSYTWVLENGQPRRVPSGSAPAPTPVTSMTADAKVATQRRRQRA